MLAKLEEHVRRSELVLALREAERLMMLPDLAPQEQGRLFRLAGRVTGEFSGPYAGIKLLEMAIPFALRAKDWDCLGAARADLGTFWLMAGDYSASVEWFQAYLLDLDRYISAKQLLGHVHYNLALAYRRKWEHRQAIEHYEAAAAWFTEKGYTMQAGITHQNLAWVYCLTDKPDLAATEIEIAESFAHLCGESFKIEQMLCRAFTSRLEKRIKDAMLLVREVLQPGRPHVTPTHKANAAWIAGSIALDIRDFKHARFYANLSTQYAIEAKDTGIMSLATRLKAEAARRMDIRGEAAQ